MKRILAMIAALTVAAPAASAAPSPWYWEGEIGQRWWHWDISAGKTGRIFMVVHGRNARWIDKDRLRVEFSIRSTGDKTVDDRSWMPYVLYDEKGRCDGSAVCDPPLFPVVQYDMPLEYRNKKDNRFLVHSATIDCKNAPIMQWKDYNRKMNLNMEGICRHYR